MAFLAKHKKADLKTLAYEMGIDVQESDRIADIIKLVKGHTEYDEEIAKGILEGIVQDREREREREEQKLKEERENQKLSEERAFELEKLRLTQSGETSSVASSQDSGRQQKNFKAVMQKFEPEKSDMVLFLTLFERQMTKSSVEETDWVDYLLPLLPVEVAELIIREPEEEMGNYDNVKSLLLDRFKLSSESFRVKFQQHQRKPGMPWKDLVFELRSYLEGWLDGIKVKEFKDLKNLMICDQIKRRVPPEIKDHFLDDWANLNEPSVLVRKLDDYETNRKFVRKPEKFRSPEKKFKEKTRVEERPTDERGDVNKGGSKPWSSWNPTNSDWRKREFERKREIICYKCKKPGHISTNCTEPNRDVGIVNNLVTDQNFDRSFKPFLSQAKVNHVDTFVLRDTGSSIDLGPIHLTKPEDFTGEKIWVKQPLDKDFRCLPLARIKLESPEFGTILTKAAIVGKSVDLQYYVLGNSTQELIDSYKNNSRRINAVTTRRRNKQENKRVKENGNKEKGRLNGNSGIGREGPGELTEVGTLEPEITKLKGTKDSELDYESKSPPSNYSSGWKGYRSRRLFKQNTAKLNY